MVNVFVIGSKGIPANYGGYETFVENLTSKQVDKNIAYHVACMARDTKEFVYNGAHCFNVNVPNIGPAKAIYYDIKSFEYCIKYIKKYDIKNAIVYVLTCRIGPFFKKLVSQIHQLGGKVFLNPDGHEWLRAKWGFLVKKYWKFSEKIMVKYSDLIVCDSLNIESYIRETYSNYCPNTTYIAYGADINKSNLSDEDNLLLEWYEKHNVKSKDYYLVVGRFVPENNYEIMIREFIKSKTTKQLVLITNVEKNKLYKKLQKKYKLESDKRINFVGTVYNYELLKKIRENAYAYLHGHSVGGTNPSLLEALASTNLNLLYDVGFNRECGKDSALYFDNKINCLANLINYCDSMEPEKIQDFSINSTNEVKARYTWDHIISSYENLFHEYE